MMNKKIFERREVNQTDTCIVKLYSLYIRVFVVVLYACLNSETHINESRLSDVFGLRPIPESLKAVRALEILGIIFLGFAVGTAILKLTAKKHVLALFNVAGVLAILSGINEYIYIYVLLNRRSTRCIYDAMALLI